MVKLKGTEKQVIWANEIRENMLNSLKIVDDFKKIYKGTENKKKKTWNIINALEEKKNEIINQDSAKFFIDNRFLLRGTDEYGYQFEIQNALGFDFGTNEWNRVIQMLEKLALNGIKGLY